MRNKNIKNVWSANEIAPLNFAHSHGQQNY